jgi:hypothetical protein
MRNPIQHPDQADVVKEALGRLDSPARRRFLTHSLTLGGLSLLTGCDVTDSKGVETALERSPVSTTRPRPGCSIRTVWRRPIPNP